MPVAFTDLNPDCSEEAFGDALMQVAHLMGYLCYHQRAAQRAGERWSTALKGDQGFPDWVLVHSTTGATIFAELKAKGGRVSPHQQVWLDALGKGPTPVFLWRPSDWAEVLSVLEAGARAEPHDRVSEGSKPLEPVKASDDPHYRHAEQTVTEWWEWHKARNAGKPPTAMKYVAVVKIVQKLYAAGWTQVDVKRCLIEVPVVSVPAMEFCRNKRRQSTGHAVNEMSIEEWRKRNAGRPLTQREPKPAPTTPDNDVIDTTATEVTE